MKVPANLISPAIEEIGNRGLAAVGAQILSWSYLYIFYLTTTPLSRESNGGVKSINSVRHTSIKTWFLLWGPIVVMTAKVVLTFFKSPSVLNLIPDIAGLIIPVSLLIPAQLEILAMARCQGQDNIIECSDTMNNRSCRGFVRKWFAPSTLDNICLKYVNIASLWASSEFFGRAHFPAMENAKHAAYLFLSRSFYSKENWTEQFIDRGDDSYISSPIYISLVNYTMLQKYMGTLLSSLAVEGRLTMHRKTLWCAIGAHSSFNWFCSLFRRVVDRMIASPFIYLDYKNKVPLFRILELCIGYYFVYKWMNLGADIIEKIIHHLEAKDEEEEG